MNGQLEIYLSFSASPLEVATHLNRDNVLSFYLVL